MFSTNSLGNLILPSSPKIAPTEVIALTPLSGASARPISSKTCKAELWILKISSSVNGLYEPPINPGFTGRNSLANGADLKACLALLPPDLLLISLFGISIFIYYILTLSDFGSYIGFKLASTVTISPATSIL